MTIKLYDDDSYIKEFEANVVDCREYGNNDEYRVILDRTAFFPTEGGQYHDNGTIAGMKVLDVFLEGDEVVHVLPYPVDGFCRCEIDFEERFDKMQQHTGEHIVCGIVHELYGYENVGFHLGPDDVTFDFNGMLSENQLYEVERLANKVVSQNKKILAYYLIDPKSVKYRSKKSSLSNIRLVEIEDVDYCACCAPHVRSTGEVGLIKFTDAYSYKGGIRIHLACGERAIRYIQEEHKNLTEIAKVLSSGTTNAAEFFRKYVCDVEALKKTLSDTKKELVSQRARAIDAADNIILFEDIEPSMLRPFVNELSGKYENICAVFSGCDGKGYNYVIASEEKDLREFIKEFNSALCGKGGGSPKMVQGSVLATKEQIENYLNSEV